ncbi:MAG: right-handed parallel beta-helix repeat-containing protein [Chloroflexi bacterium]|nr:right-handed parallel beta-helix repeat-containing protein [Chloroflexota bacterium]
MPSLWEFFIRKRYSVGIGDSVKRLFYDTPVSINWNIHYFEAIRNGMIRGFYQGIKIVDCQRVTIENCVVSDNHNPADTGWLTDTASPNEEGFGGGIYLAGVTEGLIEGNTATGNFNGVDLVRCERVTVRGNNASHSGNVGIHLLASSDNVIEDNQADHCIRFAGRFWNDTADSAGILLEEYSHRNRIVGNSLRHGGDGFFIRANNRHPSNDNYVARNDGSFSPNNAFEATFSEGNLFEDNVASFSNYGFWLGYSRRTTVRNNRIISNRSDGVAIEHGSRNSIESNEISGNLCGVRLWWSPSQVGDDPSEKYVVRDNTINGSRQYGVYCLDTRDVEVTGNRFDNNSQDFRQVWEYFRGQDG